MAGEGNRNADRRAGRPKLWLLDFFKPQMLFWWKFLHLALQHTHTTWLCKVPEFKLLGVEVFETRRKKIIEFGSYAIVQLQLQMS